MVYIKEGDVFQTRKEDDSTLIDLLHEYEIDPDESGINVFIKESKALNGLGLRVYGKRQEMVFLGKEISEERDYGDDIANAIDGAVHGLIQNAYNITRKILTDNHEKLVQVAERLIVEETIEGEALNDLFDSPVTPQDPLPDQKGKSVPIMETPSGKDKSKQSPQNTFPGDSPPEPLGNI